MATTGDQPQTESLSPETVPSNQQQPIARTPEAINTPLPESQPPSPALNQASLPSYVPVLKLDIILYIADLLVFLPSCHPVSSLAEELEAPCLDRRNPHPLRNPNKTEDV
ncbi:unnamed protein product [Somion occarium]|uniref:Uncharacterized protein n=1 Tax=Somion occarium TaxID=3059160 RepID=A0ABP1CV59_9APHY